MPENVRVLAHCLGQSYQTRRARRPARSIPRSSPKVRLGRNPAVLRRRPQLPRVSGHVRLQLGELVESSLAWRDNDTDVRHTDPGVATPRKEPAQHQAPLDPGWYTSKSVPAMRPHRVEGQTPEHSNRSHQRHQRRQPLREPADALSELPQSNGDVRLEKPKQPTAFPLSLVGRAPDSGSGWRGSIP